MKKVLGKRASTVVSILLTLVVVAMAFPLAGCTYSADWLEEQLNKGTGSTALNTGGVTLNGDVELDRIIECKKNVVLNLNGYTITATDSSVDAGIKVTNGCLLINGGPDKDHTTGSNGKTGVVEVPLLANLASPDNDIVIVSGNIGAIVPQNANITIKGGKVSFILTCSAKSKVTVKGGRVLGIGNTKDSSFKFGGLTLTPTPGKINIDGGTIDYLTSDGGNVTMNGGTISGVTVTGGKLTVKNKKCSITSLTIDGIGVSVSPTDNNIKYKEVTGQSISNAKAINALGVTIDVGLSAVGKLNPSTNLDDKTFWDLNNPGDGLLWEVFKEAWGIK